jgi:hypothetical protein
LYDAAIKADDKLYKYFNELIMAFVSGKSEKESKQAVKETTKTNEQIRARSERVKNMPYKVVNR